MKSILIKLLFILLGSIFLFYLFYSPSSKFDILENPAKDKVSHKQIEKKITHSVKQPALTEGIGQYIGKPIDVMTNKFGYPNRIYSSNFSYRNFVYKLKDAYYIVGVKDNRIKMIYATGKDADVAPYEILSPSGKMFDGSNIVSEPIISTQDGDYQFQLSEADIKTQALVEYEGLFMQVLIDRFTGKIMAVRYLSPDTLVEMQPYAMSYNGKTIEKKLNDEVHRIEEIAINSNEVLTMFELTNTMRELNALEPLDTNEIINHTAQFQVAKLSNEKQQVTSVEDEIGSKLSAEGIDYHHLSQNIGYNFEDVPGVINSWMNSVEHRNNLLNKDINAMGGGISGSYNSLIFLEDLSLKED